jgi:hypothetical protein
MRFDKNDYPLIDNIKKGQIKSLEFLGSYVSPEIRKASEMEAHLLGRLNFILSHKPQIYFITKNFQDVVFREDVENKLSSVLTGVSSSKGVFLMKGLTFFYNIDSYDDSDYEDAKDCVRVEYMAFRGNICLTHGNIHNKIKLPDDKYNFGFAQFSCEYFAKNILILCAFMEFSEIDEKILYPKTGKFIYNCKYVNNTDKSIRVLDSSWYTSLIRSEGFNVRGHFRLQPIGEGRKERKLIWINDFQKEGYVREAKKLKEV